MAEKKPLSASSVKSLLEIELPSGEGPREHPGRFLDPAVVAAHFAPFLKNIPSAEERWARKNHSVPFIWPPEALDSAGEGN
ncbi:MAG: hypothetical protein ACQKBY_03710 [Verrucomicrobiales bacterium]